jgi:conjugal transfer pilus assembly protein TraU
MAILITAIFLPFSAGASLTCKGRFVNPLTDICWSCILPINIGGYSIGKGSVPKKRDTANPKNPVCICTKANIPIPGISIGFWEPVRLVDITRTPYCMTNLGGMSIGSSNRKISSYERRHSATGRISHNSFYHVHYYVYPLIYWLELITDFACLEEATFDVAYMSEFDIAWNDPKMQTLLGFVIERIAVYMGYKAIDKIRTIVLC